MKNFLLILLLIYSNISYSQSTTNSPGYINSVAVNYAGTIVYIELSTETLIYDIEILDYKNTRIAYLESGVYHKSLKIPTTKEIFIGTYYIRLSTINGCSTTKFSL